MENPVFTLEVPVKINIIGGEYNEKDDCTSIEIETAGLHIIFDLQGKYKSKFAQGRIAEGVRRLSSRGRSHLAHTHLWLVIQQLP